MNLSVYVPKHLQEALRERARRANTTPSRFVQQLVKERLAENEPRFSDAFVALAGSWEDSRTVEEIIEDIRNTRQSVEREPLR